MQRLSQRIGRERLEAIVEAYATKSDEAETLYKATTDDVTAHLLELLEHGVLKPFDALPNRRMNLSHSWNVMCGTEVHPYSTRERETREIARRFGWHLVGTPLRLLAFDVERGITPEKREDGILKAMQEMDSGTVRWWMTGGQEEDHVSGEHLAYELQGWNLVFGHRPERGDDFKPAEDISPTKLHHFEIDLPTGEILIRDWFQDDGFTNLVDEGDPWRGGSQMENEADAERYARDHGFISVSTARRSLTVFRKGNRVTIGRHDEDGDHPCPDGYKRVKDFMVDLRKVTIADRASLSEILAKANPQEDAPGAVDRFARNYGTVTLSLPAGRYRVVSSGRGYIEDLLPEDDPLRIPGYEPVLILEPA